MFFRRLGALVGEYDRRARTIKRLGAAANLPLSYGSGSIAVYESDAGLSYNAERLGWGTGVFRLMKASASRIVANDFRVASLSWCVRITRYGNLALGTCMMRPAIELMWPPSLPETWSSSVISAGSANDRRILKLA
jgi:hypothetical protein